MQLSFDTQQELIEGINQSSSFHEAIALVLDTICGYTHWDYGEAWIPCQEGTILELHSAFHLTSTKNITQVGALEEFRLCSHGLTFPPGVGLPGRVWLTRQAEWLSNASSQSEWVFVRNHMAKAFGVKTGFGVPILANHCVLGVLVFFMLDMTPENKHLTEQVLSITRQIGDKLDNLLEKDRANFVNQSPLQVFR